VFTPAVERASLEKLRIHDLRHTAAALAITAGAHPKAIQERPGHASVATTLNIYGHPFPALDEELAARLDDVARAAAGRARDDGDTATLASE
jgi:integrase